MTVEEAVWERLLNDAGVVALVSTRVYQLKIPQNTTMPAVRVQLIDEPVTYHLRGEQNLTSARVQVDCFGSEVSGSDPYAAVLAVAQAAHLSLSGQTFTNAGSPQAIQVTSCFRRNRRVMYEADELRLLRVLQDYEVWSRPV